eukprot:scaffold165809_cov31-Prasinocladus_malaysianus.AAC.1
MSASNRAQIQVCYCELESPVCIHFGGDERPALPGACGRDGPGVYWIENDIGFQRRAHTDFG